jgi:hypothetical protein
MSRFDASPGHSCFIFFYNQQVTAIQQKIKLSVPCLHGSRAVYVSRRKTERI